MADQPVQPYSNTGAGSTLINPYLPSSQAASPFWLKPVYATSSGELWSPGVEGPTYSTSPQDYVIIGGAKTPGIIEVDCDKEVEVDRKKAAGKNGERLTLHGLKAGMVQMRLTIWTPEQLRVWNDMWSQLFLVPYAIAQSGGVNAALNPGNLAAALVAPQVAGANINPNLLQSYDVAHPTFSHNGVKSIVLLSSKGPVVGSDRKGVFTIKAIEWWKMESTAKKVVSTPVNPLGSIYDQGAYPTPGSNPNNLGP